MTASSLQRAVEEIVLSIDQLNKPAPRILIDGRSGAGKTTLSMLLGERLDAEVIHLEDIYPGWSGLRQASRHVTENLLSAPRPRWQRWDWVADAPAEWHDVSPDRTWIIEGCGSLSVSNRALADMGIWIDADDAVRKHRALARSGETYEPFWQMWADQEQEFIESEHPRGLADVILCLPDISTDGSPLALRLPDD